MENNLSLPQQLGLKTLSRKVARLELVVLRANKGKSFVVVSEDVYRAMAHDHVMKDVPTTTKDVSHSQSAVKYGEGHGEHVLPGEEPLQHGIHKMHGQLWRGG